MRENLSGLHVEVTPALRSCGVPRHEERLRDRRAAAARQHGFAPA